MPNHITRPATGRRASLVASLVLAVVSGACTSSAPLASPTPAASAAASATPASTTAAATVDATATGAPTGAPVTASPIATSPPATSSPAAPASPVPASPTPAATTAGPTASPTATGSPAGSPSAPPSGTTRLGEAIAYAPATSGYVMFTDWARMKRAEGKESLTGAASFDEKLPFLMTLTRHHASSTGFGLNRIRSHHQSWGWDALDFDWEAQWLDEAPVWLLRFREGIDLSKTRAVMDRFEFATREFEGATIRSRRVALAEDWATTTELAIANTAFLPDGRTLIASSNAAALERALTTHARGAANQASLDMAAAIGDGTAVVMLQGTDACRSLHPRLTPGVPKETLDDMVKTIDEARLEPYDAFVVGYDTVEGEPVGVVAMHFADDATAQDQAAKRERIAATALSIRTNKPFAETVFTVSDRQVVEGYVFLKVAPAGGVPKRLFDSILIRDALYAAC